MKRVGGGTGSPAMPIAEAPFPSPFSAGLEYSVPARGGWTIVHVGMLMPQAHEIFVCAAGCLRGVVLSAAEMHCTDRFSTIAVEEHNIIDGDMEELLIEGVTDILHRLPELPKAVLVYSSCIHHFMGTDLAMCYRILRERFPDVDFADCYMTPIMRKSGLTPDQLMRKQLYSLLKPAEKLPKHCAVIGNCFSMDAQSDMVRLITQAGWTLHQITECSTYADYQQMAVCSLCISTQSVAKVGGDALANRLGMQHLALPLSYGADEIRRNLAKLADALDTEYDGGTQAQSDAESALARAKQIIGNAPVALDYTFTPRPLSLARLLCSHGFHLTDLFADAFSADEHEDFLWLQSNAPQLVIRPTVHAAMRKFLPDSTEKTLALGQKAAYFTDSPYFVNQIEGGSGYGFQGITALAEAMCEAFSVPKDTAHLISMKGLGCESCI